MLISCRDQPTRYCVDANQTVADERNCQTGAYGHTWYYGGGRGFIPVGSRLSGGSFQAPRSGFSTPDGTVHGGFGGTGEHMASGHASGGAGE